MAGFLLWRFPNSKLQHGKDAQWVMSPRHANEHEDAQQGQTEENHLTFLLIAFHSHDTKHDVTHKQGYFHRQPVVNKRVLLNHDRQGDAGSQ